MNKEKRTYKWIIIVPIIIILSGLQALFLSFLLKDIVEQSIIIFITVWVVCAIMNLLLASILNEHLRLYFFLKSINKEDV
ncbi:MAG: hypothetical protein ACFFCI_00970 [Promethearchaeota archaeon]